MMEVAMLEAFWNRRKGGYSETVAGFGDRWDLVRKGQVFI